MVESTNTFTETESPRMEMATVAALEIATLAQALMKAVPRDADTHFVVRGMSARIEDLSNAILDAIQDDVVPDSQIARTVRCNH